MSKPSQKKEARRRKREQRSQERSSAFNAKRELFEQFPKIVYGRGAPVDFIQAVRSAINEHIVGSSRTLPKAGSRMFRTARTGGFGAALPPGATSEDLTALCLEMGERFYRALPPDFRTKHFPLSHFRVVCAKPLRNQILVQFFSLERRKAPGGTAYYSPREPKVNLNGSDLITAFSRHAIDRISDRTVVNPDSYAGVGDIFAHLHDCIYHEPWISGTQEGFVLFDQCNPPFFTAAYAEAILDKEVRESDRLFYRVGYCPCYRHENLLVAKTMLTPGMKGTPEYDWYVENRIGNRSDLHERASQLTYKRLTETDDFSLLKQFHEGGILQLKVIKEQVYDYSSPARPAPTD